MSVVAGQVRALAARSGTPAVAGAGSGGPRERGGAGESGRREDIGVHARRSGRVWVFVRAFKNRAWCELRGPPGAYPPPPAAPRRARRSESAWATWEARSTRTPRPEPTPEFPWLRGC